MADTLKVILFEDTEQTRSDLLAALKRHLQPAGEVVLFEATHFKESETDKQRTYEDRLESILTKDPYQGATLVVADQDLSKSPQFIGLSANAVLEATKRLAIPMCSYARQTVLANEWRGRWEEGQIVLSFSNGEDGLARRASLAARGFEKITKKLPAVLKDTSNSSAPKILAALLGKPEYSDKIALYSVGDQNRVSEIPLQSKEAKLDERRMARFLGYWLWDSLLRYPGLLVNEVAAASHLNVATVDFRPEVQALFEEAIYRGPFADSNRPQWWRGMLDDLVARENCTDGLELVQKKVSAAIRRSQCCVDPSKPAGYYCIILQSPVSLENSKGGLSWFPRGADLTRISNPQFEEYGPWLSA